MLEVDFFALVVQHARLPGELRCIQKTKAIRNQDNQKQRRLFPKWNIDMVTLWQDFSVHMSRSNLYMLRCINKNHSSIGCPAASTQNITNCGCIHVRKASRNFYSIAPAPTFANSIILLTFADVPVPIQSIIPWLDI